MSEHERRADELERELDDMQEQSQRLGDEIDGTREDWERKQRDDRVPGAVGDPDEGDDGEEDPPPEAQEPPGDEDEG